MASYVQPTDKLQVYMEATFSLSDIFLDEEESVCCTLQFWLLAYKYILCSKDLCWMKLQKLGSVFTSIKKKWFSFIVALIDKLIFTLLISEQIV